MCGIAGIVSRRDVDAGALAAMNAALRHRGPDGEGFVLSDLRSPLEMTRHPRPSSCAPTVVGLAHRRLSVIDLSAGSDQPLVDETGTRAIVFNGEIYNYVELRSELEQLGHAFRTSGDTEVALRAYAEWGIACFSHFVGMWAIAILDRATRTVTLCRDRFGIKPLYWALTGDHLVFASEIKALFASRLLHPAPNQRTLARYLLTAYVDIDETTFFDGIQQLPPATLAVLRLDQKLTAPQPSAYWALPQPRSMSAPPDPVPAVRDALASSVRLHMRSDVPVGTCLSGGIDSSGIVAVADTLRGSGVDPTFTHAAFGYVPPENALSEARYMDAVARARHVALTHVSPTRDEFIAALPAVIATQDEPFRSASVAAQWFVFRAARDAGITVMLDGQGADEVFGGYHGYLSLIAQDLLLNGTALSYARFVRACRVSVGYSPQPLWFITGALLPRPGRLAAARLLRAVNARRAATRARSAHHLRPALRALVDRRDLAQPLDLDGLLRAEVQSHSLPSLLRYEDRNSMAHSIEARVPYLDHRLVELAFSIPAREHLRAAVPKRVLREALADALPPMVRARRDKIGFRASPSVTWTLARQMRDPLIANHNELEESAFKPAEVARLFDTPSANEETEFALWRVINAKLWARRFWG